MRKYLRGAVIGLILLTVGASSMRAVDYYSPLFGMYLDYEMPAPSPCGGSAIISASTAVVFDSTLMVHYVCSNMGVITPNGQREVWRRYFRPENGGNAQPAAIPVYVTNPTPSTPTPQPTPGPVDECRIHNLVPSKAGGCVPANHPDAK